MLNNQESKSQDDDKSCCQILYQAWQLIKKTLQTRRDKDRNQKLIKVLQTRAWILHALYSFFRLINWIYGTSAWLGNECINDIDNKNDCPSYNRAILDPMTPVLRNLARITIILGLVLDLVIIKYRKASLIILYYESVVYSIYSLIPTRKYLEHNAFFFLAY